MDNVIVNDSLTLDINLPNKMIFSIEEDGKFEEVLKLEKGKFIFKGEEVKDVNKVYERFCEWMSSVDKKGSVNY